jgi:flagellar biosynthesis chaperone FliJ
MQAHDFEAYQEMLRETAGPGTAEERYQVISNFLKTTEEYLHKLASKVATVKLTQEASEAAARAISQARAQVC